MTKTAELVKKMGTGFKGDARLYKLSEPLEGNDYVIVSAVAWAFDTMLAETLIFGSNEDGTDIDWLDLPGSFRGAMDHEAALEGAGYEVTSVEA